MLEPLARSFPNEILIIGRILAGYTEIEFWLLSCVDSGTDDFDALTKIMFRTRGETQRIEVADAMGRQKFIALGLGTEFSMAIGSVHHCRKIRNQYSHCNWSPEKDALRFIDMEGLAKLHTPVTMKSVLPNQQLTLEILQQQEAYFDYTEEYLFWLADEARTIRGKSAPEAERVPKPKQLKQPPLYKNPN